MTSGGARRVYNAANGTVLGWIMNQARSRAIDRLRFDGRRSVVTAATSQQQRPEPAADPRDVLELREQGELLRAALLVLTPAERQAIETTVLRRADASRRASRLDLPLGTVKTRIRSGLHKLRQALAAQAGMPRMTTLTADHAAGRRVGMRSVESWPLQEIVESTSPAVVFVVDKTSCRTAKKRSQFLNLSAANVGNAFNNPRSIFGRVLLVCCGWRGGLLARLLQAYQELPLRPELQLAAAVAARKPSRNRRVAAASGAGLRDPRTRQVTEGCPIRSPPPAARHGAPRH